jgi:hypothetical protein
MPSKEEIEQSMTPNGGYTRETLAGWGVPWPPPKGWKRAIVAGHRRYYENEKLHVNQAFQMSMKKYVRK